MQSEVYNGLKKCSDLANDSYYIQDREEQNKQFYNEKKKNCFSRVPHNGRMCFENLQKHKSRLLIRC